MDNIHNHHLDQEEVLTRKNRGMFYTPQAYAVKSHELLRKAISRVPEGNDYVIIDRCAGTGNLEKDLTREVLSHCILSTIDYNEWKALRDILGAKVRCVLCSDALSREFLENPAICQYLNDPRCTIILFENPPYAETSSIEHQKMGAGKKSSAWKSSFLMGEMRKDSSLKGTVYNDLGNLFVWSGFKFYLRQPTDSYLVYSPVKYWKIQHLIDREFLGGFAFNRRHFHTNIDACIMCALWGQRETSQEELSLEGFDIDQNGALVPSDPAVLSVRKIHCTFSQVYHDRRKFADDLKEGILAEFNGTEAGSGRTSVRLKPVYNQNILGHLVVKGANFDNPDSCVHLLTVGAYDGHGFYLRKDNYLTMLPTFCASRYITYNGEWTERGRIMKSGDGADRYFTDTASGKLDQWLLKCLFFTCVEMQNHMRTFTGSDGRFYRNELCLDTTNGDTLASIDLARMTTPDDEEKMILKQWNILLEAAKKTKEYDPALTYGVYQIYAEIDTSYKDEDGKTVWNNVEVHSALQTLKVLVRTYYNREIVPVLFEYEFLK